MASEKNVRLDGTFSPATEKLTATRHRNGTDIWVIGHEWGGNAFMAFKVTASGVNSNPIKSYEGHFHGSGNDYLGCMKTSPDGSKIGVAKGTSTQLFDFDNQTGKVSNTRTLLSSGNMNYGVEFSPNSQVMYVSNQSRTEVRQFDVSSGDVTAINNSAFNFNVPEVKSSLQLGQMAKSTLPQ